MSETAETRLKKRLDQVGWRSPYHEHFKIWQPTTGPPQVVNCGSSECEAKGCPRTESGFPAEERS
jgi:hypothetical protein